MGGRLERMLIRLERMLIVDDTPEKSVRNYGTRFIRFPSRGMIPMPSFCCWRTT